MCHLLAKTDQKDDDLWISLLDTIHLIAMEWDRVTPTTLANCLAKCGFFSFFRSGFFRCPLSQKMRKWGTGTA